MATEATSDFEIARRLQESEYGSSGSAGAPAAAAASSGVSSTRKFVLYHYNGLEDATRRPVCVPMVISQPDDSADLMDSLTTAPSDADIAVLSVVRTKWPGASVDTLGKPAPKLD